MFPIRDHNPSGRFPFVTIALIVANLGVFLAYYDLFAQPALLDRFFLEWALIPAAVSQGAWLHGLLTSMFLHGGIMHLAGNMLFLWIFGDNLEDMLGHWRFLGFYLLSGLAAGGAQVATDPGSIIPMVGASGAIAGVMGGYLLLFPRARIDVLIILVVFFKILPVPAWLMLAVWFGLQLVQGVLTPAGGGGVAYWAHAGGFVAGLVLVLPVWLARGGRGWWARTEGHPPHPEAPALHAALRPTRIPRSGRRR